MCVLCMFYVDWSWEGGKNFRVGIFFEKKLVRVGLQETKNFFLGLSNTYASLFVGTFLI